MSISDIAHPDVFELPTLTPTERDVFLDYAEKALRAEHTMRTTKGQNILHYTLRNKPSHDRMIHYPKGDRIDKKTGAQYFYHCHRENYDCEEHGHFHCFIRYPHIPKNIEPTPLEDWDKYIDNPMTHLIAIGMNRYGKPTRLFTTNRWVTSEIWYDAKQTKPLLTQFQMTLDNDPYWTILDQWIEALLHLFLPQIIWLRQKRDAFIKQKQSTEINHHSVYNDKALSELSEIPINIKEQVQWILG